MKRYEHYGDEDADCSMVEQPDGEWVMWEDGDKMRDDADRLRKALFRANARAEKLLDYAQHRRNCPAAGMPIYNDGVCENCTCGLAELEGVL